MLDFQNHIRGIFRNRSIFLIQYLKNKKKKKNKNKFFIVLNLWSHEIEALQSICDQKKQDL